MCGGSGMCGGVYLEMDILVEGMNKLSERVRANEWNASCRVVDTN